VRKVAGVEYPANELFYHDAVFRCCEVPHIIALKKARVML